MKPTLLMVPRLPAQFVARLAEHFTLVGPMASSTPQALPAEASGVRAMVTMGTMRTDAALIDALPALELISCYGTGYEGVDRAHATSKGIRVTNGGTANAASVADYAIAAALASTLQIAKGDRFIRAGRWQGNSVERMPMAPGFGGRRLGIYGLGAIGRLIAKRAEGFGVEIAYHNRNRLADVHYAYHDSLLGLATWADILIVSARAGIENRYAINAEVLKALGPQGHLVNISRGIAVDEAAMADALEAGTIAGAALDVFEHEPNVPDRLKRIDTVILTPHIAANATAAQEAQQALLLANLEAFFGGRELISPV